MPAFFRVPKPPRQDEKPTDSAGGVFYAIGTPDFSKMFEAARVSIAAYAGVADSMHIELPGHATVDAALAGATGKGPEEFTLYEIRPIGRFKQTRGVEAVE